MLEDCVAVIADFYGKEVFVERSDHVVNVDFGVQKRYQFILRIYPRIDIFIGGFDIGASMIAFDGVQIYTTQLGAWSLAKKAIIVDTTRRSTSYEYRLEKYTNLSFMLVFPGLDIEKIQPPYSIQPTLNNCFSIKIQKSKIPRRVSLERLKKRYPKEMKMEPESVRKISDYGHFNIIQDFRQIYADSEIEVLMSHYYASLLKTGWRSRFFVYSSLPNDYEKARKMFASMIDNPQIKFCKNFIEEEHNKKLQRIPGVNRLNVSKIDSRVFAEYFFEFQEMMNSFCKGSGDDRTMEDHEVIRKSEKYINFITKVTPILNNRITERAKLWTEDMKGLKWITKNPGTQHTASINPIIEDPRQFYINCYKPFIVGIPREVEYCIWVLFRGQLNFPSEVVRIIVKNVVRSTHLFFSSGKPIIDIKSPNNQEVVEKSQKRKRNNTANKKKKKKHI
eukprot:TRINITY_DN2491_c0_g1_i1.p1 TRINITY_DN2491_c0_g1~~TRINITY_DN2491_c0_g1_i1.p1  ORF type:complete len:477 (+),score=140.25 TRINITY_DN2491_c0_g1_i1:90-1433(+)